MPFKGADLSLGEVASVNSIAAQIETAHDYDDPEWITIEGLTAEPSIEELTFTVMENEGHHEPGATAEGQPDWDLPVWEFEPLIAQMARRRVLQMTQTIEEGAPRCRDYGIEGGNATATASLEVCLDHRSWLTMVIEPEIAPVPPPQYLWQLVVDIAQVRLHDGGVEEGEADVVLPLRDVAVGVEPDDLVAEAKANLSEDPAILREFAGLITNSTNGDADFYYVRVGHEGIDSEEGDWLFFVNEQDLRLDEKGQPVRGYDYDTPGFFADANMSTKVSSLGVIDGDETHEKLRVVPGDVVYVRDDDKRSFEIQVGEKPGRSTLLLEVTRID